MEDEATKEDIQPSTSRKDQSDESRLRVSPRTNSRNDSYDHDRHHDERASNSASSVTATYSARSRIDMGNARPEPPKPATLGKREAKAPEKKSRGKKGGRVEKRRRSYRRQLRRAPMRKKQGPVRHTRTEERRHRDHSISTIFSRLSSGSGSRSPLCDHCGHRCCRRRAKRFVVRSKDELFTCRSCRNQMMLKKKIAATKKLKEKLKLLTPRSTVLSKQIQTGSRSHMWSPLFIKSNSTLEEVTLPEQTYSEVTPEMIFDSLCVLNLWREDVQTALIMKHIMRNYPVNKDEKELFAELTEKLTIAAIVGIVTQTNEDSWRLAGELEQRQLTANHVTLFWKAYADTLRPISRKVTNLQKDSNILSANTTRETKDDII